MKKVLSLIVTLVIYNCAFGSDKVNNIFTGKTEPTNGAAAVAVAIAVDEDVLKDAAIANGKSQCYKAGFTSCNPIDETFDTVQDKSGFYAIILVRGYNEIPAENKPSSPNTSIQPPVGSICVFVQWDDNGYGKFNYYYAVVYSEDLTEGGFDGNTDYIKPENLGSYFNMLKNNGVCESYKMRARSFWDF